MSVAAENRGNMDRSLVERIVSGVAETKGIDTEEIDPLYNAIDPDALTDLFQEGTDGRVVFEFEGCEVTVSSTGQVDVVQVA